jgi:methyl-accepting chemotaxis protein
MTVAHAGSAGTYDRSAGGRTEIGPVPRQRALLWRCFFGGSVRARLLGLVAVLVVMLFVCVGVAAARLLSSRSKAIQSNVAFKAYQWERDAYEGWVLDDDQSNAYAAVASLRDPSGLMPGLSPPATQAQFRQFLRGQVEQGHQQAVTALASLVRGAPTALVRAGAGRAQAELAGYNVFTNETYRDAVAGDPTAAVYAVTVSNAAISNILQDNFDAMDKVLSGTASSFKAQVLNDVARALWELVVLIFVAVLVAIGAVIWVSRAVVRPLRELETGMSEIAAQGGDLTRRLVLERSDEIGRVALAFNRFVGHIHELVISISKGAGQVSSASGDLSAMSRQIGSSAAQTSSVAGSVATAAGEVSSHVHSVAAAVEEMSATIGEIMQSTVAAARTAAEGKEMAQNTNALVTRLGASTQEINEVTHVISALAAQTKLLALNASIEAARAGDAGRGFAVVASEVQSLAQETAKATQRITSKIDAIQADSGAAVSAVSQVAAIIARLNDVQSAIASTVEEGNATAHEIARRIADATVGVEEIANSISGVAGAASDTTSAVEDTSHAVNSLSLVATDLLGLANRFRY